MTDQTPDSPEPAQAAQSGAPSGFPSGRWTVDPDKSRAEFAVKHFWGLITVRGKLNEIAGELTVHPAGGVDGSLRINAASVDTGNRRRDKHLRSADFFGSDEHPEVVFTPSALRKLGESSYQMDGTLAITGHTEELTLDVGVEHGEAGLKLSTTTTVDRRKFGMTWGPMGIARNDAALSVEAHLSRSGA
jgi:polyisoprenoid-binding protein YceI